MSWTIPFALFAWIPLVAIAFVGLAPSRAVLVSFLAGWMFLPVPGIEVLNFDYGKSTAVPLVVFLAVVAFDGARLSRFRPSLVDVPIAVFCLVPMATSLANGLGWYDAISGTSYQVITWGLPYVIGRTYFSTARGLRQLAVGLCAAGLVYAPLCLWEIRMSPQLHAWVYGVHQHEWVQTLRSGGFRPMVFLQHGLDLGLWMCAASIAGLALWTSGSLRKLWGIPLSLAVPLLFVTTILGKSFGSILLLLAGALSLFVMRFGRTSLPMALMVAVPATYVMARTSGDWAAHGLVELVSAASPERAHSLAYRIEAEEKLRVRAAERPVLGWGGFGRSFTRRFAEVERTETVTLDSLWIIVLGKHGVVGLASLLLVFCTPVLVLWRRCSPASWYRAASAGAWGLALVLTLFAIDCLVNAMVNPVYLLIAGGLCGLAPAAAPARVAVRARGAPRLREPALGRLA
jgi:hypothetical protein